MKRPPFLKKSEWGDIRLRVYHKILGIILAKLARHSEAGGVTNGGPVIFLLQQIVHPHMNL